MKIDYASKGSDTMITKNMTLADVVKAHPNTIGFLNGLHLDYCCGGHDPIAMAETEELLNKILIVHYPHHGKMLTRLHHLYAGLKAELEEHFAKEEQLVFPLMRQHPHPDSQTLSLIQDLETEHTGAGDVIKEIQELTDNFTPPADACPTFRHTYVVMEQLFDDIFIHIFKENSIAFSEYAEQV